MLVRALFALSLLAVAAQGFAASIQGRVTDAGGAGFSGVQVRVYTLTAKGWAVAASVTTDGSGNYSVTAATGDHLVDAAPPFPDVSRCLVARRWFDAAAPFANGTLQDSADVITLASAGSVVTGINMSLPTVGGMDGRITQGGVGLNGMLVRVERIGDPRVFVDTQTFTFGGVAGSFLACSLDAGPYRIWTHSVSGQHEDLVVAGPFLVAAGSRLAVGSFNVVTMGADPNEPNPSTTTFTTVPSFVDAWTSTNAIIAPRGSDVDFYCLNALAGDRYQITTSTTSVVAGEPRSSPWVDPLLGWYSASPLQQLAVNDDDPVVPGSLESRIDTGVVAADGRYCVAATTFGDSVFNGSGQTSAGRYSVRIARDLMLADGFEGP